MFTNKLTPETVISPVSFNIGKFRTLLDQISILPNDNIVICRYLHDKESSNIELFDIKNKTVSSLMTVAGCTNKITVRADNSFIIGQSNGDIHLIDLNNSTNNAPLITIKSSHGILGLIAMPNDDLIAINEDLKIQRRNLYSNYSVVEKKLETIDPSIFYGNLLAVLNSAEGCYLLKHSKNSLELYDTVTLQIKFKYFLPDTEQRDDFNVAHIRTFDDGKRFICLFTSSTVGGYPRIAIGNIYHPSLTLIAEIPRALCKPIILTNGLIVGSNGFSETCKVIDITNINKVICLSKPEGVSRFYALSNGHFLCLSEDGNAMIHDSSNLSTAKDLFCTWLPAQSCVTSTLISCEKAKNAHSSTALITSALLENIPIATSTLISRHEALDQWIINNEPFSSSRMGQCLIEKLNEFKTELFKTFENDWPATREYVAMMNTDDLNGREMQRLENFMKALPYSESINPIHSENKHEDIDIWVRENEPFSSSRMGHSLIKKINEFKEILNQIFKDDIPAILLHIKSLDTSNMNGREIQRLKQFINELTNAIPEFQPRFW